MVENVSKHLISSVSRAREMLTFIESSRGDFSSNKKNISIISSNSCNQMLAEGGNGRKSSARTKRLYDYTMEELAVELSQHLESLITDREMLKSKLLETNLKTD